MVSENSESKHTVGSILLGVFVSVVAFGNAVYISVIVPYAKMVFSDISVAIPGITVFAINNVQILVMGSVLIGIFNGIIQFMKKDLDMVLVSTLCLIAVFFIFLFILVAIDLPLYHMIAHMG